MRPLSLRKKLEELAGNPPSLPSPPDRNAIDGKIWLIAYLKEIRPLKWDCGPKQPPSDSRRLLIATVHIRFTGTTGEMEIGFRLDRSTSNFSAADFENEKSTVHIEGSLTLNYVESEMCR
jgi:hypothetical protein